MENFEKATKKKLRFETAKGAMSVEQLWDLSLESLDTIGMKVKRTIDSSETESLLGKKIQTNTDDQLRLDIIKHIIGYKQKQLELRAKRQATQEKVRTLELLAAQKENEQFSQQSLDEIRKQLAELRSDDSESED